MSLILDFKMNVKRAFTLHKLLIIRTFSFVSALALLIMAIVVLQQKEDKAIRHRTEIALRMIGDQLLRSNKDFLTPVPPVRQIDANSFRLSLHLKIGLDPDKLVELSLLHLTSEISRRSIVRVLDFSSENMVYGFELNHGKENDIPCLGRKLPKGQYVIEFSCKDQSAWYAKSNLASFGFASIALLFTFLGFLAHERNNVVQRDEDSIEWNRIKLKLDSNRLQTTSISIKLTEKEAQILAVLIRNVGTLVSREDLVHEVWLKNGVITSRSLDMYISRLRKKMAVIPNIQITNQYGKGYFLQKS